MRSREKTQAKLFFHWVRRPRGYKNEETGRRRIHLSGCRSRSLASLLNRTAANHRPYLKLCYSSSLCCVRTELMGVKGKERGEWEEEEDGDGCTRALFIPNPLSLCSILCL